MIAILHGGSTRARAAVLTLVMIISTVIFTSHRPPASNVRMSHGTIVRKVGGDPKHEEADVTSMGFQEAENSATGTVFKGNRVRIYKGSKRGVSQTKPDFVRVKPTCDKWNVVTTIYAPSDAVRKAAAVPGWCTVIVADTKTPPDYMEQARFSSSAQVTFLSVTDQQKWASESKSKAVLDFVDATPLGHFSRKNIGYLYAVAHGARFVFDFDDDNALDVDTPLPNATHLEQVRVPIVGPRSFNHHTLMGASVEDSWARGFPLKLIQNNATRGEVAYGNATMPTESIAVMQFCANKNPDVDAVHRLVKPLPMTFSATATPLAVPSHTFAPYNAQATIHTLQSFFALLLPMTVPGRVSDIWRGYFAQALFRSLGLQVVFLPPQVTQDRNEHELMGDMQAESKLYYQTDALLKFLSKWPDQNSSNGRPFDSLPEAMEALWIALYERAYIEAGDVHLLQFWLDALEAVGYEFPKLLGGNDVKAAVRNRVVIMGQFNFPTPLPQVRFWVQKWKSQMFRVVVRGPFPSEDIDALRAEGIDVSAGGADAGYVSPIANLAKTLRRYRSDPGVDGVLYVHDDAFLALPHIFSSTDDLQTIQTNADELDHSFTIHPNGTLSRPYLNLHTQNETKFLASFDWGHLPSCLASFRKAMADPRFRAYLEEDGSLFIPEYGQSDMLYVPTKYERVFVEASKVLTDHETFLECAAPKLTQILESLAGAPLARVRLCTEWNATRGTLAWLESCPKDFGTAHPFKMGRHGFKTWSEKFDEFIQRDR